LAIKRRTMDVGLVLMSHFGSWDDAAYAEGNGFATAGFVDSPLIAGDPFVAMALTAERTSTLRVGSMLAVPGNRNPATLVTAIATVNRVAPGRTFLGIGTGFTGRAVFGLRPISSGRLSRYVNACRALLDGEEIEHREAHDSKYIRLSHGVDDRYVSRDGIPVYVAADGPRALDVAGRSGDGWITSLQFSNWMVNAPDVMRSSFGAVKTAAADAGRELGDFYTMCSAGFCVLEEGEAAASPRALEYIGAYAMMPFHAYADNPAIAAYLPPAVQDRLELYERVLAALPVSRDRRHQEVHRGHLSHLLPGEAEVLTDDIVRMTTLTGTASEIAAMIRKLDAAGLRNLTLNPPPHLVRSVVRDYAERIAPLLASAPTPNSGESVAHVSN
jgi:alkanesulfonate monooxygenase SsuD/methylene tetrahydromethanopterin reductase-like flavin-dependent oxidoreductase (luciferase family)